MFRVSKSPFNRTSMESKLTRVEYLRVTKGLLIEPVWNRNLCKRKRNRLNRNPFNRTSMESKQHYRQYRCKGCPSFNRTSMESKPKSNPQHPTPNRLLIEPVWNRNSRYNVSLRVCTVFLLIEPVWNRNVLGSCLTRIG